MSFTFRPAIRESIWLLIGVSGGTGSGKTYSALRMAKGLSGDKKFALIDTEAGRAKHYAEAFSFDHGDLTPPFTPDRYLEAIVAAEQANYGVIVVDSMSHEWAGDGGILDMQEDELDRMAKDDYQKREACKMAAWVKPKMAHKRMTARLLQLRAHLILCFRAEPKVEMRKENGKMVVVPRQTLTGLDGWIPICEKNLPYELTASFLLSAEHPGIPRPIKLQEQHKPFFALDQVIAEDAGRLLDEWARGGKSGGQEKLLEATVSEPANGAITLKQAQQLGTRFRESLRAEIQDRWPILLADFLKSQGYENGNMMLIPALFFKEVGQACVKHAKEL